MISIINQLKILQQQNHQQVLRAKRPQMTQLKRVSMKILTWIQYVQKVVLQNDQNVDLKYLLSLEYFLLRRVKCIHCFFLKIIN